MNKIKKMIKENKYVQCWTEDIRFRMNVSLYGTFIWNSAYALLQFCLGLYHKSFWYYSMAGYYICLSIMRFYLVRHTSKHQPGEKIIEELKRYRTCGWIFLIMNITLAVMVFFMVYWNRTFYHNEITTITLATYTFTTFTVAVINIVKSRRMGSPVYSASKAISLAAACVSMITLTSTMITSFGEDKESVLFRKVMLGVLGGVVAAFIIVMAIYMIVRANRELKENLIGENKYE